MFIYTVVFLCTDYCRCVLTGYVLRGCRLHTSLLESPFVSLEYNDGLFRFWPHDRGSYYIHNLCSMVAQSFNFQVFAVGSDGRCYGSASIETAFRATNAVSCPSVEHMSRSVYRPYYWPDGYNVTKFMVYEMRTSRITSYRPRDLVQAGLCFMICSSS